MACLAASACFGPRADPSTFYVLSAVAPPAAANNSIPVVLGLGPVTLPAYLDRSELVTRVGENQLAVSPTERWAEPLDGSVVHTLEANLEALLRPEEILAYPWYASAGVVYGVEVDFTRLEADGTGTVTLEAEWAITTGDHEETLHRDRSSLTEAAAGPNADAAVAAMSRALSRLSEQIAAGLRSVHGAPAR